MMAAAYSKLMAICRADPALAVALFGAFAVLAVAVLGPLLWPIDPLAMDFSATLAAPELRHPLGTDPTGRDVLARVLAGARISLTVGLATAVSGLIFGGLIGTFAGLAGPIADLILARFVDALASFPPLILAMAVTVGLGGGVVTACIGIALSTLPYYSRLIRADILRLKGQPFIEAAQALGASPVRIVARHLLPHAASTILVQSAAVFGYAILTLAGLGFVGLGAPIPTPEWGTMITEGIQYALTGGWWIAFFPGLAIVVTVIIANVLADRLRDWLDPRMDVGQSA
jgi:peptide/nickel transport system permease protein